MNKCKCFCKGELYRRIVQDFNGRKGIFKWDKKDANRLTLKHVELSTSFE